MSVLFLDISIAFNRVNHLVLPKMLAAVGFSLNNVKLFASYLSRTQIVCFNYVMSNLTSVGIVQGSVLVPLIFVFFY